MTNEARIRDWRLRAEELRAIAEALTDRMARRGLLTGAAAYDALAEEDKADVDRQWPVSPPKDFS